MTGSGAIAVLYYNKMNLTIACIESVVAQGYSSEKIFCFDNGSRHDNSEKIRRHFPALNHKRIESNKGFSGGFNGALHWIFQQGYSDALFLTNDTIMQNDSLGICRFTGMQYNAGIAAPVMVKQKPPHKIDSCAGFFDIDTATLHHYHQVDLPAVLDSAKDYIPGTALWINADCFYRLDGADESFHTYWEDSDLSFRAHDLGIRLVREPQAVIFHGIGRTCHKKPLYTTYLFQRNRIRFIMRHLNKSFRRNALKTVEKDIAVLEERFQAKDDLRRLELLEKVKKDLQAAIAETAQ